MLFSCYNSIVHNFNASLNLIICSKVLKLTLKMFYYHKKGVNQTFFCYINKFKVEFCVKLQIICNKYWDLKHYSLPMLYNCFFKQKIKSNPFKFKLYFQQIYNKNLRCKFLFYLCFIKN